MLLIIPKCFLFTMKMLNSQQYPSFFVNGAKRKFSLKMTDKLKNVLPAVQNIDNLICEKRKVENIL